jgi:hypothetical protein
MDGAKNADRQFFEVAKPGCILTKKTILSKKHLILSWFTHAKV